ncbi:hypothetical protein ACFXG4_04970 [Nocardia sp. NPDC059246]|uniref:hypothetical protein n=1 Tax=unclassified Nocardia TaxID=2637762 RepID=UPI003699F206
MATPLFELTDVQAISGETFVDPEIAQVERFVRMASARMRSKVSGLDSRIAAGTLDADIVIGIGVDMVLRALATVRRGIDVTRTEYPEISTQYAQDHYGSLLYLTDAELADLLDTPTDGDAFTISIGGRP